MVVQQRGLHGGTGRAAHHRHGGHASHQRRRRDRSPVRCAALLLPSV